ncbi:MAG: DMT family protein [Paludibacteraceae bacterium]|nr:DMT family protein [Paludibacteraceae bacterium]
MNLLHTVLLLIVSNIFMTLAWYGHLKLQQLNIITDHTPLIFIILISWGLAFFEYCCQVPANRIGFVGNGGTLTLMQLKVIQEVISISIFTIFALFVFKGQTLQWNHLAAFVCLIMAVYFVFMK